MRWRVLRSGRAAPKDGATGVRAAHKSKIGRIPTISDILGFRGSAKPATSPMRHVLSFGATADFFPFPAFFVTRLEPTRVASSGAGWCG